MSERNENTEHSAEFGDTLAQLSDMADALDRRKYPGTAWPVRRRRSTWILWPAVAAAAAAVLLVSVLSDPKPTATKQPVLASRPSPRTAKLAQKPQSPSRVIALPKGTAFSMKFDVTVDIPNMTIPSGGEAGGFQWDLPDVSFPSSSDRSKSNESQKDDADSVGSGGGGRPDRAVLLC